MSELNKTKKKTRYINPYLGGVLLGLTLIAANFVSGRGLGASGAAKSAVVATVNTIAPAHAENAEFFQGVQHFASRWAHEGLARIPDARCYRGSLYLRSCFQSLEV